MRTYSSACTTSRCRSAASGWTRSVCATAPFVGLFGTVWGIYHALISISIAGQASLDKVAGPIGEALIMTAIGLAVAVPAVLGFNALTRGNKSLIERVGYFCLDSKDSTPDQIIFNRTISLKAPWKPK